MWWWIWPMSSSTLAFATPSVTATTRTLARFRRQRGTLLVFAALIFFVVIVVFGAVLGPYDPLQPEMRARLQGPSAQHLMGTDPLGRDVFSRVLAGAQLSIQSVVVIIASAVGIGTLIGAVAGYFGG